MHVTKRDGSREPISIEKFHRVIEFATEDLTGVSVSEIALRSQVQMYDGISTKVLMEATIKAAADLISEEAPNYQYVAGRLVNYHLRKQVYGSFTPPPLVEIVRKNTAAGFYDPDLLAAYSADDWDAMDKALDHNRDQSLTYAAMEQLRGKYLVQNRVTKTIMETPQVAYMLIAATLFSKYPAETRMTYVVDYYDAISTHEISLPTPVMAGVRTPQRQFSSCVLIETDDSLKSISATSEAVVSYVSQKAGIGLGVGRIRALGSPVRNGDTSHTGVTPFYKLFQAAVKSCSQGAIRNGSATCYYPCWHLEIEDMLVLKNNKGTEETRVRHMDYAVQFNKLFYERLIAGGDITLFSPHDLPEMYEAFFNDNEKFKVLYEAAEKNPKIRKKTMKAIDLFSSFVNERRDTGRIYLMNVDHANTHSSFDEAVAPIRQSNLCLAGDTYVSIQRADGTLENIQIQDLAPLMAEETVKVLSMNLQTGMPEYKDITAWAKTHPSATVIRITDDTTGVTVVCTPDHQIYTRNRGYVKAGDLTATDRLCETIEEGVTIETLDEPMAVYDITVADNENFFANDILVHNCAEISLPTVPMATVRNTRVQVPTNALANALKGFVDAGHKIVSLVTDTAADVATFVYEEDLSRIALCTLSAINWGLIKKPSDFERPCRLAIRALDALLDYQDYPVEAARRHSMEWRPLGVGIINFAYFLAKHNVRYSDGSAHALVDEYAEAWSYYLIRASVDLAKEKGACLRSSDTKYGKGILPIDTYKREVDELVAPVTRMPWEDLRADLLKYGIRNATTSAVMPAECQHWANKIALADGRRLDFHELLEDQGYDWAAVEATGIPQRFALAKPVGIETRHGVRDVHEVYYNGVQEIYEIEFEDGVYRFTGNHLLYANRHGHEDWARVDELQDGDNVMTTTGLLPIRTIRWAGMDHTWDVSTMAEEYLLPNGVISHNTSAQVANATNGIEPPRAYVSVKQSKDGILKQVVPELRRLKNKYELLWDQRSPDGYLKLCAILQKYIDQTISTNTSYNPRFYPDEKIPMSEMLKHLLLCYKYGIKTLYYNNVNDQSGEMDVDKLLLATVDRKLVLKPQNSVAPEISANDEAENTCDSCVL